MTQGLDRRRRGHAGDGAVSSIGEMDDSDEDGAEDSAEGEDDEDSFEGD